MSTVPIPPNHDAADLDLLCPTCGYNLRGTASDRCPECGSPIDRANLSTSIIPWINRHAIGGWRAYWRTVWLVLRNPSRVGREVGKPITFGGTAGFRRATVLVLSALLALTAGGTYLAARAELADMVQFWNANWLYGVDASMMRRLDLLLPTATGWLVWPLIPLYVWLFLQGMVGVSGYWFHPASISTAHQNRALALSNLAAAPLVLLPVSCVIVLLTLGVMSGANYTRTGYAFQALALAAMVTAAVLGAWAIWMFWWGTLRLLRTATAASTGRQVAAGILLPLSWLAIALLTLVALPWTVGFSSLVAASFR
jgi:hypothetical protein